MTTMQVCKCCGSEKSFSEFYKHPNTKSGLDSSCKVCRLAKVAARYNEKANEILAYNKMYRETNKSDISEQRKQYRALNASDIAQRKREAYLSDIDRQREIRKEWQRSNPEKVATRNAKWKKSNADKVLLSTLRRLQHIKQATPTWADEFFIGEAYHIAKVREKMLGGKWHVDHIVPLRGNDVCGLHVHNNLQVIPAQVNLKKSNSFQPS